MSNTRDVSKNIISAFATSSLRVKLVVGTAAVVMTVSLLCTLFNVRLAYKVTYNDTTVGYLATSDEISSVNDTLLCSIKADGAEDYIGDTVSTLTLAVGNSVSTSKTVALKILNSDTSLVKASVITVDGVALCAVDTDKGSLAEVMDARLDCFASGDGETVDFLNEVLVETGYFPLSELSTLAEAYDALSAVDVKTVKTVTYSEAVPFETVTTESASYLKGYKRVTTKGKDGENTVTATVTCVNGEETDRTVLETVTVSEPVSQQVLVGTATASKVSSTQKASGKALFIWPLKKVAGENISAYFGDGRNHQAIDIATKKGTPIYAALGGTVTFAGYDSSYGYHVIIDHGNGYQTLYGHASSLCVSKGQVVATGDIIALVGSTGRSTGNHLHFEVRINGTRVNPISYLQK